MKQRETARRSRRHPALRALPHTEPIRTHRLAVSGELGHDSAVTLEAAIDDLCATGVNRLVLDLSGLEAIDATGVTVIAMRCRLCRRRGVAVQLVGARRHIAAAFRSDRRSESPFHENPFVVRDLTGSRRV